MKLFKNVAMLIALIFSVQDFALAKEKSSKHLYPESGFWVTEYSPNENVTIVRFYNGSQRLVSEEKENYRINIHRRSVRKNLNKKLKALLSSELEMSLTPKS